MWDLEEGDPAEIGSFRLVARLGSGGMGTVYLATQEGADGHVAVKTIRSEYAREEGFRRRFTREATAASSVRSPHTVRVVGFDTRAREPWLATEYVDGPSLRDHVQTHGPLSLPAAVDLALGLSFGLASIHKAGLVHRDLKPGNVLLTENGPKIIDFGLAYATDFSHATHTGAVLGTPGYFSPEQVQARPVSAASDIFALGAVLTFASSGDHAFRGVTPVTAQYHVVHEEPQLAEVPDELREMIAACMRKDPRERPPVSALLSHLTALRAYGHKKSAAGFRRASPADGEKAGARADPPTTVPVGSAGGRRGRWAVLTAVAAASVALGAAAGPWLLPVYGRTAEAPLAGSGTTPTDDPASPFYEPRTTPPPGATEAAPSAGAVDPRTEVLLDSLTYNPVRDRCVVEGDGLADGGMVVSNPTDYRISVDSLQYGDRILTKAVITVRALNEPLQGEPVVVHLKLPKGQGVALPVPVGRTEWSFRWPDVLRTVELSEPYDTSEPATLMGSYTITVVHGTVRSCVGFEGNPRSASLGD
ncbi:serine/threonine-protein kinase [Streptomyces sp. NPDC058052]|uniref:serine/threonine-protein kinase n=1 Tax=Streptomyces sp. NPDC058052 TaxID=3346316 RepID=UPI0036E0BDB0